MQASAYGSYEELVADPQVDVIYVGTVHTMHLPHAKMALEAGKHVVCEKPLAVNEAQAAELVALAKGRGLFLMEALWTRFFPIVRKLREILESKTLGEVRALWLGLRYPLKTSISKILKGFKRKKKGHASLAWQSYYMRAPCTPLRFVAARAWGA